MEDSRDFFKNEVSFFKTVDGFSMTVFGEQGNNAPPKYRVRFSEEDRKKLSLALIAVMHTSKSEYVETANFKTSSLFHFFNEFEKLHLSVETRIHATEWKLHLIKIEFNIDQAMQLLKYLLPGKTDGIFHMKNCDIEEQEAVG